MKYIYQHLGLGDHLICNGLIRHLIEPHETYVLFCKHQNLKSVSHMFSDLANVSAFVAEDTDARQLIEGSSVIIGHCGWPFSGLSFEQTFYLQHNIPFHYKWDSFYVPPTKTLVPVPSNPFIFVHDDERYHIDESRLPKDVEIFRPRRDITDCIFDYADVIKSAKQIHCIESSFAFLNDMAKYNSNFYIHRYSRPLTPIEVPEYRHVKEIYK
jgi:hypothetical protein